MPGTMKNRERLPIGTRVKIAQDKLSKRVGTVVKWDEDEYGKAMQAVSVLWDGNKYPYSGFAPAQIRPVREGEDE